MVSFNAATFALASSVLAFPVPTVTANTTETSRHIETSHHAETSRHAETSAFTPPVASITAAPRPWALDQISRAFVSDAVRIRSSGVPEEKASSVASVIIDDVLAPPQYTQLAREAYNQWFQYGDEPNAVALYNLATRAYTAYQEIHERLSYWQLVNYVHSEGTIFDTKLSQPTAHITWKNNTSINSLISEQRSHWTSVYKSLEANPTGSAALSTLNAVAQSYVHDFTFVEREEDRDPSAQTGSNNGNNGSNGTSLIEKLLMRAMGTI